MKFDETLITETITLIGSAGRLRQYISLELLERVIRNRAQKALLAA